MSKESSEAVRSKKIYKFQNLAIYVMKGSEAVR